MDYQHLQATLIGEQTHPVFRLLKSRKAPLILSFLHQSFKQKNLITITHELLTAQLADFLQEVEPMTPEEIIKKETQVLDVWTSKAKRLLEDWSDQGYLRMYPNSLGEDMHELTAATEKAIQWLLNLEEQQFIGTESRFKDIVRRASDLVEKSVENPEQRIEELKEKKATLVQKIDAEIQAIETSGKVQALATTAIEERMYEITRDARELLSDFKAVEDNFRKISRGIYERQATAIYNKGQIVGYTLDAMDELATSLQGRSFYAFWDFLKMDSGKNELQQLMEQLYDLVEDKQINFADRSLKSLKYLLYETGKKVVTANNASIEKLNRVLTEANLQERQKAQELTHSIKQLALQRVDNPPNQSVFLVIEGSPMIDFSFARPLQTDPPHKTYEFQDIDYLVGSDQVGFAEFNNLFNPNDVDHRVLEQRIGKLLVDNEVITLSSIIKEFPLEKGIAELLTYFSIASKSTSHSIKKENLVTIVLDEKKQRTITIPSIIYGR